MSTKTKKLPNCVDVDFMAPVTRVIVFLKDEVLLNKIVSKKARLKEIFLSGNLDPNGNYLMDGRPLDVNKTIFELLPKYSDQLTEVKLIIHAIKLDLQEDNQELYFDPVLKPFENPFRILVFSPEEFTTSLHLSRNILQVQLNIINWIIFLIQLPPIVTQIKDFIFLEEKIKEKEQKIF